MSGKVTQLFRILDSSVMLIVIIFPPCPEISSEEISYRFIIIPFSTFQFDNWKVSELKFCIALVDLGARKLNMSLIIEFDDEIYLIIKNYVCNIFCQFMLYRALNSYMYMQDIFCDTQHYNSYMMCTNLKWLCSEYNLSCVCSVYIN